jgi:two-component system, OmpR family, response regulator
MPLSMLIAEADNDLRALFGEFFARRGYEVTTVEDGMACIAALQAFDPPDVLVLNWQLPWTNDADAFDWHGMLDWLRSESVAEVAVVITTTSEGLCVGPTLRTLAHAPCLRKPFRLAELLMAVRAVTRRAVAGRGGEGTDSEAVGVGGGHE